jgi:hypothetical protein
MPERLKQSAGARAPAVTFNQYKDLSRSGVRPSLHQLIELLDLAIESFPTTYIIIDALDECSNESGVREEFIHALKTIQDRSKNLKLLITSRHFESISRLIGSSTRITPSMSHERTKYEVEDDIVVLSGIEVGSSNGEVFRRTTRRKQVVTDGRLTTESYNSLASPSEPFPIGPLEIPVQTQNDFVFPSTTHLLDEDNAGQVCRISLACFPSSADHRSLRHGYLERKC